MREHELEGWLREQIPAEPPADVDARVLNAGNLLMAQRRSSRRRAWWAAGSAAALITIAAIAWALTAAQSRERTVSVETSLAAVGSGRYTLASGTTFSCGFRLARLEILEGHVSVEPGTEPLEVTFSAGSLRMEQGRGLIRVVSQEGPSMNTQRANEKKWKRRAAIVVVTLAAGWGILEYGDNSERLRTGETVTLAVEVDADVPGGLRVTKHDGAAHEASDRSPQPGIAEPTRAVPETPGPTVEPVGRGSFRGQVIDYRTGEPIAGASVVWALSWASQSTLTARHEKTTAFGLAEPFAIKIGDRYPQLPGSALRVTESGAQTVTDLQGFYTLPRGADEEAAVQISAEGYLTTFERDQATERVDTKPHQEEVRVTRLQRSRSLAGRIVDPRRSTPRGDPSNSALMVLLRQPEFPGWSFEWRLGITKDYTFHVELGELDDVEVLFTAPGYMPARREVELTDGVTQVEVQLESRPHLHGRVLDPQGQPIPGANVLVKSGRKGWFRSSLSEAAVISNRDGEYLVDVSGPDGEISVVAEGFAPLILESLPKYGEDEPFDLRLTRSESGAVVGLLRDDRGFAWATGGAVWGRLASTGSSARVTLQADGTFELLNLHPGTYELAIEPSLVGSESQVSAWGREPKGRAHVKLDVERVEVKAGEMTHVALTVPPGTVVSGLFRTEDGSPIAEQKLALYEPNLLTGDHERLAALVTDDDGRFEFVGVRPGSYAVAVVESSKYQLVTVDDRPVEVHFGSDAEAVRGVLTRDGAPVAGVEVGFGRLERSVSEARTDVTTRSGGFTFSGVSRGRYVFHAVDRQTRMAMLSIVDIYDSAQEIQVEWPVATVLVRVQGESLPTDVVASLTAITVDGVRLEGVVPPAYLTLATVPSQNGREFRFEGVSPGSYRLETLGGERPITRVIDVHNHDVTIDVD